jgi:hypothetical protein
MRIKGARGHPNSQTHLQNSREYERVLDQQAYDRQRAEEDIRRDEAERREYAKRLYSSD